MALKPEVERLPPDLRQALVDLCGTNHDDHLCYDPDTPCPLFDALVAAIVAEIQAAEYREPGDGICRCVVERHFENGVEVSRVWLAVVDAFTCGPCKERNGLMFKPPFSDADMPPLAGCENTEEADDDD